MTELLDGVHRIEAEVAGRPLYLFLFLGDRRLLLDAGCSTTVGDSVLPYLRGLDVEVEDLDLLVITHSDLDHQALAWIRAMSGEAQAVDVGLAGGETIRLGPGFELRVLHVPGHSPGHLALHDERSGAADRPIFRWRG